MLVVSVRPLEGYDASAVDSDRSHAGTEMGKTGMGGWEFGGRQWITRKC